MSTNVPGAAAPGMPTRPQEGGARFERHAFVCTAGESCALDGGAEVHARMKAQLAASGLKETLRVNKSGCLGQCGHGPVVAVYPEGVWYAHVGPAEGERIWREHMLGGRVVDDLLFRTERGGTNVVPKKAGPVGPANPVDTRSPFWSPCSRCPPGWTEGAASADPVHARPGTAPQGRP